MMLLSHHKAGGYFAEAPRDVRMAQSNKVRMHVVLEQDAIKSALMGIDTLVVMHTGGGKSVCYQILPPITKRICIVISPLISLMQDQVPLRSAVYERVIHCRRTLDTMHADGYNWRTASMRTMTGVRLPSAGSARLLPGQRAARRHGGARSVARRIRAGLHHARAGGTQCRPHQSAAGVAGEHAVSV